jgi:phosphoglycolate phosphatase
MSDQKVLLWDIDGTLVSTGKAGEIALGLALEKCFEIQGSIDQVDYRGRTDRRIGEMLLAHHGIAQTEEKMQRFMDTYLSLLEQELPKREGILHAGILEILEQSQTRADITTALLTGNLQRGARLKLEHYHIWHFFEFGAFADDSADRNELGPHALRRAQEKIGQAIRPEQVVVIGDTPHDIACARVIGARAVAVATGGYTAEELLAHAPDMFFADFRQPEKLFQWIATIA